MTAKARGAAQLNVAPREVGSYEAPRPPLSEQQRIVAILDEAFDGIASAVAATEQNLVNARELFESYLASIFSSSGTESVGRDSGDAVREGWETKTLEDLCEFRNGLWKGKKPPYVNVGIVRNTNFSKDGTLDDSDIAYHDVEEKQFSTRQLRFGDLVLEKSGGGPKQPVGRVIPFEMGEGLYSFSNFTSVIRVIDQSALDYRFLHRLLHWYYISGVTEGMQRRSTGIRNLIFPEYKGLQVPLPPLPEQQRIVAIVDGLSQRKSHLSNIYDQKLQDLSELKQSILQKAFAGELTAEPDKALAAAGL